MTLIAVVLNGHQTHYSDTKALFDFGFDRFQALKAVDHETSYQALDNDMTIGGMTAQDNISLELDKNSLVIIPKDADFSDTEASLSYELDENAPDHAIARILYEYQGHSIGQVYLCSAAHTQANTETYPPDHRHSLHRQKPALLLLQKLPSKRKFLMQMPVPAHRHVPPLPKRHFHSF